MSPEEQLQAIQERADRMAVPDPTGMRIAPDTYLTDVDRQAGDFNPVAHIVADLSRMVAALRAVLDLHRPFIASDEQGDFCVQCSTDMPCQTVRKITEALGGGA